MPLGALGPALVCNIVWLPDVAVGVAVPEPRILFCEDGGIVCDVMVVVVCFSLDDGNGLCRVSRGGFSGLDWLKEQTSDKWLLVGVGLG